MLSRFSPQVRSMPRRSRHRSAFPKVQSALGNSVSGNEAASRPPERLGLHRAWGQNSACNWGSCCAQDRWRPVIPTRVGRPPACGKSLACDLRCGTTPITSESCFTSLGLVLRSQNRVPWNAMSRRFRPGLSKRSPAWKKKVEQGVTLAFLDESGFSLKPTVTRTWAVRGQTPIITTKASWDKLSTIGAITTTGQFLQHTHPGAIRGQQVVAFCRHLLRHVQGKLVVLMDNARIHKTKALRAFVEQQPRLTLEYLPPYAPELNPIERVWAYIKGSVLGNFCPRTVGELKARLNSAWQRVRYVQLPQGLTHPYRSSPT